MPAYEKGTIAALSILNKLGLLNEENFNNRTKIVSQKLNKYQIFGKAIASISFPPNQLINQINDKTIICRCEDITKVEIENAVKHGAKDLNQLKTWTRCGMGPCQGRTCNYAASIVMSESLQQKIEKMGYWTGRAPVRPIPFDVAVGNFEYDQITKIAIISSMVDEQEGANTFIPESHIHKRIDINEPSTKEELSSLEKSVATYNAESSKSTLAQVYSKRKQPEAAVTRSNETPIIDTQPIHNGQAKPISSRSAHVKAHPLAPGKKDDAKQLAKVFFDTAKQVLRREDLLKTQQLLVTMKNHGGEM